MIGNGKLQNAVTRAYTPTFDKEPQEHIPQHLTKNL